MYNFQNIPYYLTTFFVINYKSITYAKSTLLQPYYHLTTG